MRNVKGEAVMRHVRYILISFSLMALFASHSIADDKGHELSTTGLSPYTQACIGCHNVYTPGIVHDWLSSRHSKITPADAVKKPVLERRISADTVPEDLAGYVVGCFECHSRNPQKHKDTFEHMGFKIHIVVSPDDCKTCHPSEVSQFSGSKKANAIKNLMANPVYHTLVSDVTGLKKIVKGKIITEASSDKTLHESCLGCHGTKIEVKGLKRLTVASGEITVPDLTNWPNQGVGRENPDGSFGACTACHPRHAFSIEVARQPYTCAQCHEEPDVPAWDVYKESKHGNIFFSKHREWDMNAVPWTVGKDFKAPTCAVCHNSLIVTPRGSVLAERTHDFGSRLWVRLFGLIYSHPQPLSGDTSVIRNKDNMPLPTTFAGLPASEFLIDKPEQDKRLRSMKAVCNGCHNMDWINGHFAKLANTIQETDAMTLAATNLMIEAWSNGIADKSNPFDEPIEQRWTRQWLFFANSVRYASAMTGAPDYAAFKHGWWDMTNTIMEMRELIDLKSSLKKKKTTH
jgi:hydroxylamine dehydrogenase